ncbi:amino acid permease [Legionella sp. MW5194]|uniref:APC family permease n=1 Tax=Legionella sp. MW5194 TaxID=2662448 RepID=UPI00193D500C|nr:APC family permease [Legionella sp. MW5194]QRN04618.1 amino acid permease [Legionella sp. MW5194]
MTTDAQKPRLQRELGLFGATMMGLGSIIGTGIFVSVGVAAGRAGPSVILAIGLSALVAVCNAFSSAQLAASHPVSGGTYEYGYRYLHPSLGFTAGWMFLCAKTASAATAALGFAGYLVNLLAMDSLPLIPLIPIAVITSVLLMILVLGGLRQTNWTNMVIVSVTLITLLLFVCFGLTTLSGKGLNNLQPFFPSEKGLGDFFYATALMFVAYTGYGRVATLGEEVKNPKTIIPRAIIATLTVSAILYTAVSLVAVGTVGAIHLAQWTHGSATPLERVARTMEIPGLGTLIALGACTSMLGVLLNLILGLSRVALAMGRQGDLPVVFARVSAAGVPRASVIGVGMLITGLVFVGNVETTWAFSALTVLIYYSITNLAALRLPKEERLYHPVFAVGGLLACLFLAFWIPLTIWITGLGLIIGGLIWHVISRLLRHSR